MLYFFSVLWAPPGWCAGLIDDLVYPVYPLTEKERATLGVVGITKGLFLPEAVLETFAKDKGTGAGSGAAQGFLEAVGSMGPCSGSFCGIAALLWIVTAGTAGAIYGGITGYTDALPAEEAKIIEQSIETLRTDLNLQDRIREKLLQAAQNKTTKKMVAINSHGPSSADDKVDYSALKHFPIDSVLEISAVSFGFASWPRKLKPPEGVFKDEKDPLLSLFLDVRPRLIRLSDNKRLYQPRLRIRSKYLKRSEWMKDDIRAFFEEMESALNAVIDKVSDDIFITYYLPGEEPEYIKSNF